MSDTKKKGAGLVVLGIVILVLSLGADVFGLGDHPDFGYKQISGTVLGCVAILAGIVRRKQN